MYDFRNCLCLLQTTPLQFSIALNIDSDNFRFSFSTKRKLSKKRESGSSEPFATVQKLSWLIFIQNDLEKFTFKISLTSLLSTRLVDQQTLRKYAANSNIDWIIVGFKCLYNFYNTTCNVFRWILEQVVCST